MTKLITIFILTLGVIVCFNKQITIENLFKKESNNVINKTLNKKNISNIANPSCKKFENQTYINEDSYKFNKNSIFQDALSNLIGGLLFTLLIFGLNEYVFIQKNISGEWETKNKVEHSSFNPHKGITIEYKVHLLQLGNQIVGRGEKIRDLKADGSVHFEYPNKDRINIEINGHYKRNFLSRSKLYLLIKENGTKRITSTSFELTIPFFNGKKLDGNFISTASNSSGTTNWAKIG